MATSIPVYALNDSDKKNNFIKQDEYKIILKNVSPSRTNDELMQILEQFGKIIYITGPSLDSTSIFPFRFGVCADKASMSAIINGMSNHKSGIRVEEKKKKTMSANSPLNQSDQSETNSVQDEKMNGRTNYNQHNESQLSKRLSRDRSRRSIDAISQISEQNINCLPSTKPFEISSVEIFNCFVCGNSATMCCQRCEEVYCSTDCQDKDWAKHKHVCFRKPSLISIVRLKKNGDLANVQNGDMQKENLKIVSNSASCSDTRIKSQIVKNFGSENRDLTLNVENLQDKLGRITLEEKCVTKNVRNKSTHNDSDGMQNKNSESNKVQNENNNIKNQIRNRNVCKTIERATLPPSGQQVVLTHVEQLNRLYVRSNDKLDFEEYCETINFVNHSAKDQNYLKELPNVNDMVISQFEDDWYRALVLNPHNKEKILIAYIDFGNIDYKKLSDLKEMHPNSYNFKRYPVRVSLKNIPNISMHDAKPECRALIQNLIDDLTCLKIVYNKSERGDNQIQLVELIDYQSNKSINEKLKDLLRASEKPVKTNEKSLFLKDLEVIKLPPSEDTEIIIFDNSFVDTGILMCILSDNINEMEKYDKQLKEYALKDPTPYEPLETELCIVKMSENPETWYRASCESNMENGRFEVLLTDLGNISEVSSKNIRKYPNDLNFPCFTNPCFIKGFPNAVDEGKIDMEAASKLSNLLKRYDILTVPKIELIDDDNFIHLPKNIVDVIKKEKIFDFEDEL